MNLLKNISPASACFPGYPLETSISLLYSKLPKENFIKNWDYSNIQICPQHIGFINERSAEQIKFKYQSTNFRLHANVRLFTKLKNFDAGSNMQEEQDYIYNLKKISNILDSKAYSYHAPNSEFLDWENIRNNVLFLQDYLKIPVAIEGLYPTKKRTYWDNSFYVYEKILNSDLNFAIDLSHLNIAYSKMSKLEQQEFYELSVKLINNNRCLEIHISGNDGSHDEHKPIQGNEWWFGLLSELNSQSPILFCESRQN